MKKTANAENEKLLYSYHTQLVSVYDEKIGKSEIGKKGCYYASDEPELSDYFDFPSGFGDLLADLAAEDQVRKEALESTGVRNDHSIDFGHLLIVLSRIIPLIDMTVKRICDMNIGVGVAGEEYSIHSMKEALIWLDAKADDSRELAYHDLEKLRRFLQYQVIRFKNFKGLPSAPENIHETSEAIRNDFENLDEKNRIEFLHEFKYKKIVPLIEDAFSVFELLHSYHDYMKVSNKESFESQNRGKSWAEEYRKIYHLAMNVQNIIFRRFVSLMKINDVNIPHGAYSYSDFVSTTMSDSNLINSDFHFSDFSDAVFKGCDISASDLTYIMARGADFSGSNMNACNLSGSVFENATLMDVQMLNVLFRDPKVDFIPSDNWVIREKKLNITRDFAKKRDSAACFEEKAAGVVTEKLVKMLGNYECDCADMLVDARNAMDGLCERYGEETGKFFDSFKYKVITPEALKELEAFYNSERLNDRRKRETQLKINPISSCFKDATMSRALLPHADISHVDLCSVTLNEADLNDATCYYTNFRGTSMVGANLSNAEFYKAPLEGANLSKANLINVGFIDCFPKGASFANGLLINATFVNTDAKKPYISSVLAQSSTSPVEKLNDVKDETDDDRSLNDCSFNNVIATGIVLAGLNADQSTWVGAEMRRAVIFNTAARWTQFDRADLSYSLVFGASFHQASFSEAMFANARLYACDFSGIRLHRSNFISTRVEKVVIQNADMSKSNLSRAEFRNCAFSDVNFSEVNVSDAFFENVIFDNVNFSSCIGLSTARFKHCYFSDSCYKLQFQTNADGKANKDFMSIPHGAGRVKFFRDDEQDYRAFGDRQYTSINCHIEAARQEK